MLLSAILLVSPQAMTGALAAGRRKMDVFGVILCVRDAIGGGSVRDILLAITPRLGGTS